MRSFLPLACAVLLSLPTSPSFPLAPPRHSLSHGHPPPGVPSVRPSSLSRTSFLQEEDHVSDTHPHSAHVIRATSPPSSTTCKQTYGVLPCTRSIVGGLFLLGVYGFIIFTAARFLAEGSELLLVVLGTGIVGGLLLPIFGVLPDSILVLVSGIGGSKADAQEEVLVGIGLLAGSNIMLLTLLWGTCLILGRCNLEKQNGKLQVMEKQPVRKFDLCGTGVEVDKTTRVSAGIMCASIIPLLIVQIPHTFHTSPKNETHVIIGCIISLLGLLAYIIYQIMAPSINRRKELKALHNLITRSVLKFSSGEGKLVDEDGKVNEEVLERMFKRLDTDNDTKLTRDEVRVMLTVSSYHENLKEDIVEHFMRYFDTNKSNNISWEEFLDGMKKWCKTEKVTHTYPIISGVDYSKMEDYLENIADIIKTQREAPPLTKPQLIRKSIFLLLLGTILVGAFAEPLVDAVTDFSHASHIPSFFVSFVLLPIASNASEAISSIIFASYRQKVNMSLTYSQIYGAVAMNNTMSLGILLGIIYARRLEWNFSSEVLIICLVTLVMGVLGLSKRVLPFWMSFVALLLYPLAIAIVAILDHVVGWQ